MTAYTRETYFDEFVAAREQFEKLMCELGAESTQTLEHGEVESLIVREGNELLRRLMQSYVDQRSDAEDVLGGVTGADGQERRHCRVRSRGLMTMFGEITVRRLGYSGAGLDSVFPLDGALNLARDKYSHGLRSKVGLEVAKGSFEDAVKAIDEGTCAQVPKRQSEQLSRAISVDFDAYYASRPVEAAQGLLVMTTEGRGHAQARPARSDAQGRRGIDAQTQGSSESRRET